MRTRCKQKILAVAMGVFAALTASGAVVAETSAQAGAQDAAATKAAPVTPECKVALAKAKGIAAEAKGLKGSERLAVLERAAKAFEQVLADHAADRRGSGQAAWEAGELWRRHGSLEMALVAYRRAVAIEPGRWAERAGLGAADMLRRQKKMAEALEAYRKVVALGTDTNRAHDARVHVARCLDATDNGAEALQAYRDALEGASTARQVIDAGNWLAKALIARADLDGAQAAIAHVEKAVAAVEAEAGERARLDKLVQGMSCRRQLQRALDKANGADKDAADLEKRKGG